MEEGENDSRVCSCLCLAEVQLSEAEELEKLHAEKQQMRQPERARDLQLETWSYESHGCESGQRRTHMWSGAR